MSFCPLFGSGGVFFGVSSFESITSHRPNNVVEGSPCRSLVRCPLVPNCVGVKYENKNMVTGPDGALHQE
jgi:hypothetical protein